MKFSFKGILAVTGIFAITAMAVLFGVNRGSKADAPEYWITIDANELNTIRTNGKATDLASSLYAVETHGDLSVIKLDEIGSQLLSGHMHDEFHKCAGFMRHSSLEEARTSIEKMRAVSTDALFVDYTINNSAAVTPMIAEAAEPNVRQTIIDLSAIHTRRHDQQGGLDGANLIFSKWQQLANGRSDVTVSRFEHFNLNNPTVRLTQQPSIIMTITGTTLPDEIVVIGGHQDSILSGGVSQAANKSPGADDDASGIASMTEVIRVMMEKDFRPQRTIQFMAYAAEEVGLVGSRNIAGTYRNQNRNVVGALQLDMTNFGGPWADIVLITDFTNAPQNQFLRDLAATYLSNLVVKDDRCSYACSDHAAWTENNYPSSMPFEAKFSNTGGTRESNTQIHTSNDTISRSGNNANHALKFTKLAIAFAGELAKGSFQTAVSQRPEFDFDGDGKADVGIFRPDTGIWHLNSSTSGYSATAFGANGDQVIPADFDGDGKTDIAVFRNGIWYLQRSTAGFTSRQWGDPTDIPQPRDFDGDGKADLAVFRPANGEWYIVNSSNGSTSAIPFGTNGDKPVAGDYDGDGKADIAVFRGGIWHILGSASGYNAVQFGIASDKAIVSDFDGDGKIDQTVFRDGVWYTLRSSGGVAINGWGLATDIPTAADFDGDGRSDLGVYRDGVWYILRSSDNGFNFVPFGLETDVPAASAFVK